MRGKEGKGFLTSSQAGTQNFCPWSLCSKVFKAIPANLEKKHWDAVLNQSMSSHSCLYDEPPPSDRIKNGGLHRVTATRLPPSDQVIILSGLLSIPKCLSMTR